MLFLYTERRDTNRLLKTKNSLNSDHPRCWVYFCVQRGVQCMNINSLTKMCQIGIVLQSSMKFESYLLIVKSSSFYWGVWLSSTSHFITDQGRREKEVIKAVLNVLWLAFNGLLITFVCIRPSLSLFKFENESFIQIYQMHYLSTLINQPNLCKFNYDGFFGDVFNDMNFNKYLP